MTGTDQEADEARRAVEAHDRWYHVIDVAPGVTTPGWFDVRDVARRVLPPRLDGRTCLDVGTFDGFWAFEMERRGAARTVAVDLASFELLDHPPNEKDENLRRAAGEGFRLGAGFAVAAGLLGSRVERVEGSVYDLDAAALGGPFDLVVVGTLLQHLRDPVAALVRVRDVVAPGGVLLLVDNVSVPLSLRQPRRPVADYRPTSPGSRHTWWVPNLACLERWARTAGFEPERLPVEHPLGASGDCLVAFRCRPGEGPAPYEVPFPPFAAAVRRSAQLALSARRSLSARLRAVPLRARLRAVPLRARRRAVPPGP